MKLLTKMQAKRIDKIALKILSMGKKALGCPVEIEFAVNIKKNSIP